MLCTTSPENLLPNLRINTDQCKAGRASFALAAYAGRYAGFSGELAERLGRRHRLVK